MVAAPPLTFQPHHHHPRRWPHAQDIEVQASHMGMGWAPEVLTHVTELLARRAGAPA